MQWAFSPIDKYIQSVKWKNTHKKRISCSKILTNDWICYIWRQNWQYALDIGPLYYYFIQFYRELNCSVPFCWGGGGGGGGKWTMRRTLVLVVVNVDDWTTLNAYACDWYENGITAVKATAFDVKMARIAQCGNINSWRRRCGKFRIRVVWATHGRTVSAVHGFCLHNPGRRPLTRGY